MKNKFVQLVVLKDIYKEKNLKLNNHGMVIDQRFNNLTVMFFNENNIGEYIIIDVDISDVKVLDFDIQSLSEETQLKLLLVNSDFDSKVSDDVMLKFVGENPLLFTRLSDKLKGKMVTENPELLSKMHNFALVIHEYA